MDVRAYTVEGLLGGKSSLAGLDHFKLGRSETLPAEALLTQRHTSLYGFDDATRCAIFVETLPGANLQAAPFYYHAQKAHAQRVVAVPYSIFNALADELPDPERLTLLHSVGRCGSTLLGQALGALGRVVTLSEPDVYTCVVGMRKPDGSRDAELTDLLRSATRFLGHSTQRDGATLLLKFRGWCLEVADLLQQACPNHQSLFLPRDLEGWIRSMGRLLKLKDPEREAQYQLKGRNTPLHTYPREHFISLIRTSPYEPATWLEDVAFGWVSLMSRYLEFYKKGILTHALTYADLTVHPQEALHAAAAACDIPVRHLHAALALFSRDVQAGTHLSGSALREGQHYELESGDIERAEEVARRHGLEPNLPNLPGRLLPQS